MSGKVVNEQLRAFIVSLADEFERLNDDVPDHYLGDKLRTEIKAFLSLPKLSPEDVDSFWKFLYQINEATIAFDKMGMRGRVFQKYEEIWGFDPQTVFSDQSLEGEAALPSVAEPAVVAADSGEIIASFVQLPEGSPEEEAQYREQLTNDLLSIPGNEDNWLAQFDRAISEREEKLALFQTPTPLRPQPASAPSPIPLNQIIRRGRRSDPEKDEQARALADKAAYYHGVQSLQQDLESRIIELGWSDESPTVALRMIEARLRESQPSPPRLTAPHRQRRQLKIPPRVANAIKQFGLLVAITLFGALLIGALVGAGAYRYDDRPRVDNETCLYGENAPYLNCHVDNPPINWEGVVLRWAGFGAIAGAASTFVLMVAIRPSRKKKESSGDNEIGL